MNEKLTEAFEDCLAAYEQGASLEDALQFHPELADELRPRLLVIQKTRALADSLQPSIDFQVVQRAQFLERAANLAARKPSAQDLSGNGKFASQDYPAIQQPSFLANLKAWLFTPAFARAAVVLAILFIVILTGTGVVNASAQSLPGTPLYGIKRTLEDTLLALSPSGEARTRLEDEFQVRRHQEASQVIENGISVQLEFGGLLENVEGDTWTIGGLKITITANTLINGNPQPGLYLDVHGISRPDHTLLATEISVQGTVFDGKVESIRSGDWQVDGRMVLITKETIIEGSPNPGDRVQVNAILYSDGSLVAEKISLLLKSEDQTPSGKDSSGDDSNRETPSGSSGDTGKDGNSKDGGGNQTVEPTHASGSSDDGTPQATQDAGSSGESGSGGSGSSSGGSGSGSGSSGGSDKTAVPTDTPQPTRTPEPSRTSAPTQTPHSSGGSSINPTATQRPQESRFQGVVQSISGSSWTVSGQTFQVNGQTAIDKPVQIGDSVEVTLIIYPDGRVIAVRIQKK